MPVGRCCCPQARRLVEVAERFANAESRNDHVIEGAWKLWLGELRELEQRCTECARREEER